MNSETEDSLTLSGGIPLISTTLLSELISKHNDDARLTVFTSESKVHPLIGIYSKKMLPILKEAINRNELK